MAEGVGRGMKLGSKRRVRVPSRLPFACWRAATTTDRLKPMSTNPWVRGCSGSSEENAPTSGPGCAHAGMTDPCVCGMAGTLCAGLGCGAGPGGSGGEGRNSGASEVCRPGAIGTVGTDADDGRRASSGVSRSICTANVRSPLQRVSASNANASLKPIPTSSAIPVKVLAAVVARAANAAGMVVGGTTGSSSLGGGICKGWVGGGGVGGGGGGGGGGGVGRGEPKLCDGTYDLGRRRCHGLRSHCRLCVHSSCS